MSILSLKKEVQKLKQALEPEAPTALVIIYDSSQREGEDIDLDAIFKINGKDATGFSNAEKEAILAKSPVHFYLPESEHDSYY